MHDQLLEHQGALTAEDLIGYAGELGLDADRFARDLANDVGAARIDEDVDSADLSGVSGTPTFFINGKRHHGAYDLERAIRRGAGRPGALPDQPGQPRQSQLTAGVSRSAWAPRMITAGVPGAAPAG